MRGARIAWAKRRGHVLGALARYPNLTVEQIAAASFVAGYVAAAANVVGAPMEPDIRDARPALTLIRGGYEPAPKGA